MQFTTFQIREREFILSIKGSFSGPPQLTPRCAIHPIGLGGIYQHEWAATARLEPGCFPWRWRSWRKSQQELCWSCRVQAGCKACPKPGDCCGAESGLLRDAGTQGTCWAGARHRCSPRCPPEQLPSSEIDLFFYSFHPFKFFFQQKEEITPVLSLATEQAFHQCAAGELPACPPLQFLLRALRLCELPGASWLHTASSCTPSSLERLRCQCRSPACWGAGGERWGTGFRRNLDICKHCCTVCS